MNKEFTPYEQALELKKIGFDEPCFGYWGLDEDSNVILETRSVSQNGDLAKNSCNAPTFSQAFRWFMEKHNLRGFIGFRPNTKQFDHHVYDMSLSGAEYVKQRTLKEFNKDPKVGTYEEAELECLKKLIEIAKETI